MAVCVEGFKLNFTQKQYRSYMKLRITSTKIDLERSGVVKKVIPTKTVEIQTRCTSKF